MVHNPKWLQMILYIGVVCLPCLTVYLFYMAFKSYSSLNTFGSTVSVLFFGFCSAYISYIGIKLSKFISAQLDYDAQGFTVRVMSASTFYSWSDISTVTNHQASQILCIFDSDDQTIYAVDHMTPGYEEFANELSQHINF